MVCTLPSARSLSKARRDGDLRENMATPDISASVKEMSTSAVRGSGMFAKPLRTKRKRASAERCLRPFGAMIDMAIPIVKTSECSNEGRIFASRFTKRQSGYCGGYEVLSTSGNCWIYGVVIREDDPGSSEGEVIRHVFRSDIVSSKSIPNKDDDSSRS